ncbi:MAG: flagellar M-ring protein FliF [Treponema sp.]|nr:flagellar M-ring protein FliF [Treponema sp.]
MEFFKKLWENVKGLWTKWTLPQKLILSGIVVVVIIAVVALFGVSSSPNLISVIDAPIFDENVRYNIVTRINQEGVRTNITPGGLIQVVDEATARRMRAILIRENLIPQGVDPWAVFDRERWTITDLERNVNIQRAHTQMITDHIKAVEGVDNANVQIVWPQQRLFRSEQNPVTASVLITPKPGSNISQNRPVIEGIQRLLELAVEGLLPENIVITDHTGAVINDFAGMARLDRLHLIEREQQQVRNLEAAIRARVLQQLQATFTDDRVRDLTVSIAMDMSEKTIETSENFPFVLRPRTPGLPYDDSEILPSVRRSTSESSTEWRGRNINPEGPPGSEGQTPPAFRDAENGYGEMSQQTSVQNEEINNRRTSENRSPQPDRISVSVNIDGTWKRVFDEKGRPVVLPDGTIEREYTALPENERLAAIELVRNAIGYNAVRGDSVTVQNIAFTRTREFAEEDAAFFKSKQNQTTVVIFLVGLAALLVGFIALRMIGRELERRKRLADEERARREQMLRESALAEMDNALDVSISVAPGDRERMDLMEAVSSLAKEHPDDCAQLIRTWLLEE